MDKGSERAWADELTALVERWPRVTLKTMMGSYALMTGDSIFGFPWRGGVTVKAPPGLAEHLVAQRHAKAFEMKGRRMGGWLWMPATTAAEKKRMLAALEAARDQVAAHPAVKARPKKVARQTL